LFHDSPLLVFVFYVALPVYAALAFSSKVVMIMDETCLRNSAFLVGYRCLWDVESILTTRIFSGMMGSVKPSLVVFYAHR
jgi:hypothetical protein